MKEAWNFAKKHSLTENNLLEIGHLVEHQNSKTHFRRSEVHFMGGGSGAKASEVQERMDRWFSNLNDMTPEEAYKEFQIIHPFEDGNGRVGKIIYNKLRNSLDNPVFPPNYFPGSPA